MASDCYSQKHGLRAAAVRRWGGGGARSVAEPGAMRAVVRVTSHLK
jgi:hypothetical protein